MRILHLIPSWDCGGAERQLAYLLAALVREGIDAHVGFFSGGMHLERAANCGATIHWLPWSRNYPGNALGVFTLMRRLEVDLVQTWLPPMDLYGGVVALSLRVPWILSERSSARLYTGSWKCTLRRALAHRASAVASNSFVGLDYWASSNAFAVRECIPNILPYEEIVNAPAVPTDGDVPVKPDQLIVVITRLAPEKNIPILLEGLQRVLERNERVSIQIIGNGPLADEVRRRAKALAPRLKWLQESREAWSWLKYADVYVSVSLTEGSPNAVLEAMRCGCALVLSDIPEHREVAGASHAMFVSGADPRSIAAGIEKVLATAVSREKYIHPEYEHHRAQQIACRYVALYETVLARRAGSHNLSSHADCGRNI